MRKLIATIALALTATTVSTAAHADPVIDKPGGVHVASIDAAPAGPAVTVTLSNGKEQTLTPCRYEDGRRCYWDAGNTGNNVGSSFLVTRGVVYYVDNAWLAAAAR